MACIFLVIFLESYLQRLEFDLCALRSYFWQIHNVPVLCCEWSWLITISACISFHGSSLLSTKYNYLFEICLIQDMSWRTLLLRPEYCRKLAGQYHGWWCPGSMQWCIARSSVVMIHVLTVCYVDIPVFLGCEFLQPMKLQCQRMMWSAKFCGFVKKK